jgi:phage tail-like protein
MAVRRDAPYGAGNFLVEIGDRDPRAAAAGFAEVILPPFTYGTPGRPEGGTPGREADDGPPRLVLRRGATGDLDLYQWWDEGRRQGRPTRRLVTVRLLADDHDTVVMTWRFHGASPVRLSYSPLRAIDGGVLMETLELEFERVDVA